MWFWRYCAEIPLNLEFHGLKRTAKWIFRKSRISGDSKRLSEKIRFLNYDWIRFWIWKKSWFFDDGNQFKRLNFSIDWKISVAWKHLAENKEFTREMYWLWIRKEVNWVCEKKKKENSWNFSQVCEIFHKHLLENVIFIMKKCVFRCGKRSCKDSR